MRTARAASFTSSRPLCASMDALHASHAFVSTSMPWKISQHVALSVSAAIGQDLFCMAEAIVKSKCPLGCGIPNARCQPKDHGGFLSVAV